MRLTTDHAASSYGVPVMLDGRGRLVDYAPGIRAACELLGWTKHDLAARTNYSVRTVEGWLQGRMPEVSALNVLRDALDQLTASG